MKKNPKIPNETPKTPDSLRNTEQKENAGGITIPGFNFTKELIQIA